MIFVFALLNDFRTVGCDPEGFRHSVDGKMALCHDKWLKVFAPDYLSDPRFAVLMHGTPDFESMMAQHFTATEESV